LQQNAAHSESMMDTRSFGVRQSELAYRVRAAAYAVILDEHMRVACVAEESGLFLPGGGLEGDEDAVSAVHREVAEECARTVEIIAPLEPAIQYFLTARGEPYELHASFFLARFGRMLGPAGQHELSWQPASPQAPPFFHECHRWAVQQAVKRTSAPVT
jgi:8-oxo-dGTP diphosphatase